MTHTNLRNIEVDFWEAADELRANSKLPASEYRGPLLGLILLRFGENKYEEAKAYLAENLPINPRTGKHREAQKEDFAVSGSMLLPETARYSYLAIDDGAD